MRIGARTIGIVMLMAVTFASADPVGWGCFANYQTIGGMDNWRAHVRLMKEAGMNTFVLTYGSPEQLAAQIDIAIEEGMLEKTIPVVAMACCNTVQYATPEEIAKEPPISGFAPGELYGNARAYGLARAASRYSECFPEIVAYTFDEPGRGEPLEEVTLEALLDIYAGYKDAGVRLVGALCHPNTRNLFHVVDIPIINTIIGADFAGDKAILQAAGREFWTYHTALRNYTPSAVRYHVGYWTWACGQRVNLNWDWAGMLGEQMDIAAPQMNDRLRAYAEGVRDYHYLAATEERLAELRAYWGNGDMMPVEWWVSQGRAATCPSPLDLDKLLPERGE